MATNGVLYPPILNATEPAFVGGYTIMSKVDGDEESEISDFYQPNMKIYFQFPVGFTPIQGTTFLHAYITKKDNTSIINKNTIDEMHTQCIVYPYRETGIILNIPYYSDEKGYYVLLGNLNFTPIATFSDDPENKTVFDEELEKNITYSRTWYGFIPGDIYKVQFRISTEEYLGENTKQAVWLQQHNTSFSEWSNCCYIKCIAPMRINLPIFNDYSEEIAYRERPIPVVEYINISSPAKTIGTIISTISEADELFSFCSIRLYQGTSDYLIEDSKDIYRSETSQTGFEYKFKHNFKENYDYRLELGIVTEN